MMAFDRILQGHSQQV